MTLNKKTHSWTFLICIAILISTGLVFSFTRLVFAPVPWPDGSAFYLPSLDLIRWPPAWRMHAQAAFVPTYDQANFNLMPALPILFGFFSILGFANIFSAPFLIKIVSILGQLLWAFFFWQWTKESLEKKCSSKQVLWISTVLGLAALWDPIIRWGTLVVRTETWVGLCWILIVKTLWKWKQEKSPASIPNSSVLWKISGLLALSAYFHFEAIILVPSVALAVIPQPSLGRGFLKTWFLTLIQIGLKTALFLSPWLIYVLLHFQLFLEQMHTQFFRLSFKNSWIANPYLLFHSLFLEHGSPDGLPKFFNLAKGLFWILIGLLTFQTLRTAYRHLKTSSPSSKASNTNTYAPLILGTSIAFWASFYLWCTKAEVWFVALCHLCFWPWLATIALSEIERDQFQKKMNSLSKSLAICSGIYAGLSILGSLIQAQRIQPVYNWSVYQDWVSCIDRQIQTHIHNPAPKIWQPHVPDILVELSSRHPNYDLTRALDFNELGEKAWDQMKTLDVLVLSNFFDVPSHQTPPTYSGPQRQSDIVNQEKVPFGDWSLSRLPKEQPNQWQTQICHYGPFWASILIRKNSF